MADTRVPATPAGPKVALVHDWLTGHRGGEHVLAALCGLFPTADLYTLVHVRGSVSAPLEARRVHASFVNRMPLAGRRYRQYLPVFPIAVEAFDLDDVDLVVSTSHCAAKAVVAAGRARHVCYCHSPMRYVWDQFDSYFGPARLGGLGSALMRPVAAWLARWDASTTHRVDTFVANSAHVAGRIRRYYNREALVVYPPVDTAFFTRGTPAPGDFFLAVSALVPYKRLDIAIDAAARLGAPLTIVGSGPDEARLRALGGPSVTFLGRVSPEELRDLYRRARAVLLPGHEDFGIAVVEAMACGTPVVALGRGGALETVDDGETGVLVDDLSGEAFADGMRRLAAIRLDPALARERALRFAPDRFEAGMRAALGPALTRLAGAPC